MEVAPVATVSSSASLAALHDAQRRSWQERPEFRRRRVALGHVKACVALAPDDAALVVDILAAVTQGRADGLARQAAEVRS